MTERFNQRVSSNGTYTFLKTKTQRDERVASSLIPVFHGMVISFVNYELRINFSDESEEEVSLSSRNFQLFSDVDFPQRLGSGGVEPPASDLKHFGGYQK